MKIEKLKKQLPHGAVKDIAEKTALSTSTVCQILKGGQSPQRVRVLTITALYLSEYKAKEKEADKVLTRVLSE